MSKNNSKEVYRRFLSRTHSSYCYAWASSQDLSDRDRLSLDGHFMPAAGLDGMSVGGISS